MESVSPGQLRVCVVGLGKIGLPLAVQFAGSGASVVGVDISAALVADLNLGLNPLSDEPGVTDGLQQALSQGLFTATTDIDAAVKRSDVIVVVVPLIVDSNGQPEFSGLDGVTRHIASAVRPQTLVIYETTLPVGTTRERFAPVLGSRGLEVGEEIFVAFSPERVFSGRIFEDLRRYPKIVGGVDHVSGAKAATFYETVLQFDERPDLQRANGVWLLGSSDEAELAKLAETTYRDVNIALANEFASFARERGLDYRSIREACNSQPFSQLHTPGIAVGGHCIPVYPRFYMLGDESADLVRLAREKNESVPWLAVDLLARELSSLKDQTVVILGACYRGGVKETAFSGVWPLRLALEAKGARVLVSDPLFSDTELVDLGFTPYRGDSFDAVIIQTDHKEYSTDLGLQSYVDQVVLDGRDILGSELRDKVNYRSLSHRPSP